MSENTPQFSKFHEEVENEKDNASNSKPEHRGESEDFSWYGGEVDDRIVREIVRLKREHKL